MFYVDNVDNGVTVDDLTEFVQNLSVRLVSCYEVKPRQRHSAQRNEDGRNVNDDDDDSKPSSKAFRL